MAWLTAVLKVEIPFHIEDHEAMPPAPLIRARFEEGLKALVCREAMRSIQQDRLAIWMRIDGIERRLEDWDTNPLPLKGREREKGDTCVARNGFL